MEQRAMRHAPRQRRSSSQRQTRATRILDAAAELVLRWGYRKTTIEDIARHANIGKGTVYLHWKTREDLFESLLMRERIAVGQVLIERMESDPAEVQLHRVMRAVLLLVESRPLLKAVFSGGDETWAGLLHSQPGNIALAQRMVASADYLELLRRRGLLRTNLSAQRQLYALNATVSGFFLIDPLLDSETRLSSEERADVLAATVRTAFEPDDTPSAATLGEVAPLVLNLFRRVYVGFEEGMHVTAQEEASRAERDVPGENEG